MNEVQLLQQLYNGFINQQTPSGFFNGLVDYLDYADSTESFDYYSTLLMEKGKPLRDKLDKAEKKAIIRLDSVRKAIGEYIEKQKIDDTRIKEHLQEYDEIKSRRMTYVGQPHAISLHNALSRVFEVLESIPESKSHISKYLVYVKGTSIAKQFLSLQEVDDFYYAKEEYEAAEKNELWGQVPLLGQIAQVIKDGKKHQLDLRAGKKSFTMNTTDLMALNILVGEWEAVRDGEVPKLLDGSPRKGFMLFDIQKIKPIADRLHNYFLKEDVDYAVTAERFKKKIEDEKKRYYHSTSTKIGIKAK